MISVVVLIDLNLCERRKTRLRRGVSDKFSFYLKSRENEIVCSLKYASLLWSIFAPLNWLKRQNFVKFLFLQHIYIFLKTILWMLNLGQTVKKKNILSALSRSCFFYFLKIFVIIRLLYSFIAGQNVSLKSWN